MLDHFRPSSSATWPVTLLPGERIEHKLPGLRQKADEKVGQLGRKPRRMNGQARLSATKKVFVV